ncbi:MAG: methyltransferase domain-containing protein [Planctomycetota bacterium]|nr:MAG: methyltransferase domain-containing protein [Planctomycetota bacterium]REJ95540.1 MAG: methyltransferase domain-containing protein [Planctomycetota bacterium]REK21926.1 MAG: methyltransferase domain-containing protein [Planctomycetota bacterium]REK32162.1 MAG: methyltransferase domain-containing protein [Planctomycetota bacterium]
MRRAAVDHLRFLREYFKTFETTGAIAPSSRFVARALTRPLRERTGPVRVLEAGPGTGAVTREIIRHIKPEDRLDVVEINSRFAAALQQRFESDPNYRAVADRSEVHVCPLQEFKADAPYDAIICGLPFNNFPSQLVEELFDTCLGLLHAGGTMSFFEYMYVRPVRGLVGGSRERTRLREISRVMEQRFTDHHFRTDWILVNLPPAWVQHLRLYGETARSTPSS